MRLLIDVDEVLCDFQTPALEIIADVTGRKFTPFDFTSWDIFEVLSGEEREAVEARLDAPGFCRNLAPIPGAIEAVHKLRSFGQVIAVTAPRFGPYWIYERTQWLVDLFGFRYDEIAPVKAKNLISGDVLIDDNPNNLRAWKNEHRNGAAFLWHNPTTRFVDDESIWFRVADWAVVQWCLRQQLRRSA